MHRVVVLALDGVMPFELGIPGRVFGTACDAVGGPLYEVVTCSVDGEPVATSLDFSVGVSHDATALARADTVVIPPTGDIAAPEAPEAPPDGVIDALAAVRPGARIVSICSAAFVLAAAGLLDGRPATTHWALTAAFRARFPGVRLDPDVLYVDDNEVLTAAGAAAGLDVCLHIVRSDHGSETANRVARRCVVSPHRDGGQRQYIDQPIPAATIATTSVTRAWALERLSAPLTLASLAAHAGMSVRTLSRRFHKEVGLSPNRWLVLQRVELARRLLETSDLSVEAIADEAGLGSATGLRQHFRRAVGVTPTTYRRTFRVEASAR